MAKIYLTSGRISENSIKEIDRQAIFNTENKRIFVIDWAKERMISPYKQYLRNYFWELGASQTNFSSAYDSRNEIISEISNSDLINILGGNTELLLKRLNQNKLIGILTNFNGILVGNSSGAYALCEGYVNLNNHIEIKEGSGILPLTIKCHYGGSMDNELINLSHAQNIYTIPDGSAIIFEDNKMKIINDVFLFMEGRKLKA